MRRFLTTALVCTGLCLSVSCSSDDAPNDTMDASMEVDASTTQDMSDMRRRGRPDIALECELPAPDRCTDGCTDLTRDKNNCGRCGNRCLSTRVCRDSRCILPGPQECQVCPEGQFCSEETQFLCVLPDPDMGSTTCREDEHRCNGICVSNFDTATCGQRCEPCRPPAFSTSTCNGFRCQFQCIQGFLECDGLCQSCPNSSQSVSFACHPDGLCLTETCQSGSEPCGWGCCEPSGPEVGEIVMSASTAFATIEMDSQNRPHVLFANVNNILNHAQLEGTSWQLETLSTFPAVGGPVDFRIDSQDRMHVVYAEAATNDITYLLHDGTSWSSETLPKLSPTDVAVDPTLTLDSQDRPHVAFRANLGTLPLEILYTYHDGTDWNLERPNPMEEGGQRFRQLALDAMGHAHILHTDGLRLLHTFQDGNGWQNEVLPIPNLQLQDASLLADDQGTLHLFIERTTSAVGTPGDNPILLVHATYPAGGPWQSDELRPGARSILGEIDATLSPSGEIHLIAFEGRNDDLYYGRYDGNQWSFVIAIRGEASSALSSVAADAMGTAHIVRTSRRSSTAPLYYWHTPTEIP